MGLEWLDMLFRIEELSESVQKKIIRYANRCVLKGMPDGKIYSSVVEWLDHRFLLAERGVRLDQELPSGDKLTLPDPKSIPPDQLAMMAEEGNDFDEATIPYGKSLVLLKRPQRQSAWSPEALLHSDERYKLAQELRLRGAGYDDISKESKLPKPEVVWYFEGFISMDVQRSSIDWRITEYKEHKLNRSMAADMNLAEVVSSTGMSPMQAKSVLQKAGHNYLDDEQEERFREAIAVGASANQVMHYAGMTLSDVRYFVRLFGIEFSPTPENPLKIPKVDKDRVPDAVRKTYRKVERPVLGQDILPELPELRSENIASYRLVKASTLGRIVGLIEKRTGKYKGFLPLVA